MPQHATRFTHVLDHIIARQHNGTTELANVALCCGRCNQYKGPNLAGIDPQSARMTRLFNPRSDNWTQHFRYGGAILVGLSPVGRATIHVLGINRAIRVATRQALIETGTEF